MSYPNQTQCMDPELIKTTSMENSISSFDRSFNHSNDCPKIISNQNTKNCSMNDQSLSDDFLYNDQPLYNESLNDHHLNNDESSNNESLNDDTFLSDDDESLNNDNNNNNNNDDQCVDDNEFLNDNSLNDEWSTLGSGTYSIVQSRQNCAVKITRYEYGKYSNLITALIEISALRLIDHPSIVTMIDYHIESSLIYMKMELAPFDLKTYLDKVGTIKVNRALRWINQLCKGVSAAQKFDLLNCDLKPRNILVFPNEDRVKICDWNVTQKEFAAFNGSMYPTYTIWYRPPEVLFYQKCRNRGPIVVNDKCDVWALGCILVEMLTGLPMLVAYNDHQQIFTTIKLMGPPSNNISSSNYWPSIFNLNGWSIADSTKYNLPLSNDSNEHFLRRWMKKSVEEFNNKDSPLIYRMLNRLIPILTDNINLLDLLSSMLVYDSKRRLSIQQLLHLTTLSQVEPSSMSQSEGSIKTEGLAHSITNRNDDTIDSITNYEKLLNISPKIIGRFNTVTPQIDSDDIIVIRIWLYQLADSFNIHTHVIIRAIHFFNCGLLKLKVRYKYWKLLTIVSLYIATDLDNRIIDIDQCLLLTDNSYSKREFNLMIYRMSKLLADSIIISTPYDFILERITRSWRKSKKLSESKLMRTNLRLCGVSVGNSHQVPLTGSSLELDGSSLRELRIRSKGGSCGVTGGNSHQARTEPSGVNPRGSESKHNDKILMNESKDVILDLYQSNDFTFTLNHITLSVRILRLISVIYNISGLSPKKIADICLELGYRMLGRRPFQRLSGLYDIRKDINNFKKIAIEHVIGTDSLTDNMSYKEIFEPIRWSIMRKEIPILYITAGSKEFNESKQRILETFIRNMFDQYSNNGQLYLIYDSDIFRFEYRVNDQVFSKNMNEGMKMIILLISKRLNLNIVNN